jgi:hypothetical protein
VPAVTMMRYQRNQSLPNEFQSAFARFNASSEQELQKRVASAIRLSGAQLTRIATTVDPSGGQSDAEGLRDEEGEALLRSIADRRGASIDDALEAAIVTLDWLDRRVNEGYRLYISRRGIRRSVRLPRR